MIDDVFGKRVAIYEQIMKGLKELDFLDLVRNNKEILMKFFVFNENEKTTFLLLLFFSLYIFSLFSNRIDIRYIYLYTPTSRRVWPRIFAKYLFGIPH